MTKICKVHGCEAPVRAKGMCMVHYYRDRRATHAEEKRLRKTARQREAVEEAMRLILGAGYVMRPVKQNETKYKMVTIPEHRLVVERALGKALPPTAIVHHVNGDKSDNRPCNLVVCPSHSYHMLLHTRQRDFNYEGTKS